MLDKCESAHQALIDAVIQCRSVLHNCRDEIANPVAKRVIQARIETCNAALAKAGRK
jgi:hypothetical protein